MQQNCQTHSLCWLLLNSCVVDGSPPSDVGASSMRRSNAFCENIRFCIFCSYHLRSCVTTLRFLSSDPYSVWYFEHVRYGQHVSRFCTTTQPRGGGIGCSGHTRNAQIKFALMHLQLRHGSTVGTNEPLANKLPLCAHPAAEMGEKRKKRRKWWKAHAKENKKKLNFFALRRVEWVKNSLASPSQSHRKPCSGPKNNQSLAYRACYKIRRLLFSDEIVLSS